MHPSGKKPCGSRQGGGRTAAFIKGKALAGPMPRDDRAIAPRPSVPDPRTVLAADALAAPLLGAERPDPQAGPLAHLRARDPRARLEAAAAELHGARDLAQEPEAPPEARRRLLRF